MLHFRVSGAFASPACAGAQLTNQQCQSPGGSERAFEPLDVGVDISDRRLGGVHADRDGVADACTPCVSPIIGDSPGYPAVSATGDSPKRRSAGPRLTLDTTVFPVTVGHRSVGSNCPTPQRNTGAGTAAKARLAASIAGCPALRRRCARSPAIRSARSPKSDSGYRSRRRCRNGVRLAGIGFRHRHLGAQSRRYVTELTKVARQCGGHRGQHADGHGGPGSGRHSGSQCGSAQTLRTHIAVQCRARICLRGKPSRLGVADQLSVRARSQDAAPRQRHAANGGGAGTGGTSPARPNSHAASADDRMPSPSAWVASSTAPCHAGAGQPVDGCERGQPPGHPASVQLVFGQPRDRRHKSRPSVVGEIVQDEWSGSTSQVTHAG